jgi:hypothetical protein
VNDADGRLVRSVEFGPPSTLSARDRSVALAVRDVWQVSDRLQLDSGARVDHTRYTGGTPSVRAGMRYALDESGITVLKGGVGTFAGNLPLAVPTFAGFPMRTDRWFDGGTGELVHESVLQPTVGTLRLPYAVAVTAAIERQLRPGLDAQILATDRRSSKLATLRVPAISGPMRVDSDGSSDYRELQFAGRRTWTHDQQLFISYVRSYANGELNDFASVFQTMAAPLVQPAGRGRLSSDARDRMLAWGTVNLPRRIVVSPVAEWHSGFLYSALDQRYLYAGTPNTRVFPSFLAADMVVYKAITVRRRSADLGVQLFNITDHRNPRDVYAVVGAPRWGTFTNSVGPIVRGYMLVKW